MLPEVSIVLSQESFNYRKVAQNHWGLTDEQMIGMHVHHHPPRFVGGRNIPEHLYVCSAEMHFQGWHKAHSRFIVTTYAKQAGEKAHAEKDEFGRSLNGLKNAERMHAERDELGRSVQGVKNAERLHTEKDELGRSVQGVKAGLRWADKYASVCGREGGAITNAQLWEDPDHPEIGRHNPGNLVQKQKSLGLPSNKENRVKVYLDQTQL